MSSCQPPPILPALAKRHELGRGGIRPGPIRHSYFVIRPSNYRSSRWRILKRPLNHLLKLFVFWLNRLDPMFTS